MNLAGPSSRTSLIGRLRIPRGERVDSTYEGDLQEFLDQLSPDEIEAFYTDYARGIQDGYSPSDHDVAMIHLLQQVQELARLNDDRALAQRIADGEDETEDEEEPDVAQRTADGEDNLNETEVEEESDGGDIGLEMERSDESDDGEGIGADSTDGDDTGTRIEDSADEEEIIAGRHSCVVCLDVIHSVEVCAPCSHYFDIGCATHLFQSAVRNETLFPPRCCGTEIPFSRVRPHLSLALIATFQQKQVEYGTLKRVYCSSPACSRFLGPISEGVGDQVYTCPVLGCRRRTCAKCRERHSGNQSHVCRPDAGATQVLELGQASGWARCPGCSHMIELRVGCFHMTCQCKTQFCYLCRMPWKTCDCPQWHEQRLVEGEEVQEVAVQEVVQEVVEYVEEGEGEEYMEEGGEEYEEEGGEYEEEGYEEEVVQEVEEYVEEEVEYVEEEVEYVEEEGEVEVEYVEEEGEEYVEGEGEGEEYMEEGGEEYVEEEGEEYEEEEGEWEGKTR